MGAVWDIFKRAFTNAPDPHISRFEEAVRANTQAHIAFVDACVQIASRPVERSSNVEKALRQEIKAQLGDKAIGAEEVDKESNAEETTRTRSP